MPIHAWKWFEKLVEVFHGLGCLGGHYGNSASLVPALYGCPSKSTNVILRVGCARYSWILRRIFAS